MAELFTNLKSVVPALAGKSIEELTSLEIMQHAIDYIDELTVIVGTARQDTCSVSSNKVGTDRTQVATVC